MMHSKIYGHFLILPRHIILPVVCWYNICIFNSFHGLTFIRFVVHKNTSRLVWCLYILQPFLLTQWCVCKSVCLCVLTFCDALWVNIVYLNRNLYISHMVCKCSTLSKYQPSWFGQVQVLSFDLNMKLWIYWFGKWLKLYNSPLFTSRSKPISCRNIFNMISQEDQIPGMVVYLS